MSALAKPMIHSSRATGDALPINAEKVVNFVKIVTPPIQGNSVTTYRINFSMEAGASPKDVIWNYDNQVDLDADFLAIVGLVSTITP